MIMFRLTELREKIKRINNNFNFKSSSSSSFWFSHRKQTEFKPIKPLALLSLSFFVFFFAAAAVATIAAEVSRADVLTPGTKFHAIFIFYSSIISTKTVNICKGRNNEYSNVRSSQGIFHSLTVFPVQIE